ncbi:type II secretion system protein [Hydrogenimonas sp.]
MRRGFTMIELIFVIVILGILAAVAIPKLAATRDDAKISKGLSEVSTALNDFGSYYTARGSFADNLSDMTNVTNWNPATIDVNATGGGNDDTSYQVEDNGGGLVNCVKFTFYSDGNITVASDYNSSASQSNICSGIVNSSTFTNGLAGTKQFGGKRIKL